MITAVKIKRILFFRLVPVFLILAFSSGTVTGETEPFSHIQEKLDRISLEQETHLEHLFALIQEIEALEREEGNLTREMEGINQGIKDLEEELFNEETIYKKKQDILKEILRSYQRNGSGSYLELVLKSDSLTMFLRRINALRDMAQNTGELLAFLEESKEKLAQERKILAQGLLVLEDKKEQLEKSYQEKLQLKLAQEEYLKSLGEERVFYQDYLANIEQSWSELKSMFSEITGEVSRIIAEGNLPPDAMRLSFTASGLKGLIDEETFNKIIGGQATLPDLKFRFTPGTIEMNLPEYNLVLLGKFVILEGHTLKFMAEKGSFLELPLTTGSLEDLFRENDLMFNFQSLLGKSVLESIEITEGYLELKIKLVLN